MNKFSVKTLPLLAAAFVCAACAAARPKPAPAAPVQAAAAPAPAPVPAAAPAPAVVEVPAGKRRRFHAIVATIDPVAGTLTFRDRAGKSRTLRVATSAALTKGGDETKIPLAGVAVGDHVTLNVVADVAAAVHVNVIAGRRR